MNEQETQGKHRGAPSNETTLVPRRYSFTKEVDRQQMGKRVVHRRTQYFIEVDYPHEQGWRSVYKHPTPEKAAEQWITRDPPSPFPCRIIQETTTVTEVVYGDMQPTQEQP